MILIDVGGLARVALAYILVLAGLAMAGPASAARMADIYTAAVPMVGEGDEVRRAAFSDALARVLVKATGRADAAQDIRLFSEPAAMVQQFRRESGSGLWVRFDSAAVRRTLESNGITVWGDDRPLTAVWLAFDMGNGERDVLASTPGEGASAALRRDLLESAQARAVPLVLPLRDSEEIAEVSFADVWGDFSSRVTQASRRYGADAVLIGRARAYPAGLTDVQWTLIVAGERLEWRGSVADGPAGLAERLARRLAVEGPAGAVADTIRLVVSGVGNMQQYGAVLAYLSNLSVVEALSVAGVTDDRLILDVSVRVDREQLARALAVRRVLEPLDADEPRDGSEMRLRLVSGR